MSAQIDEIMGLSLFNQEFPTDNLSDIGVMPDLVNINLDEIEEETQKDAEEIVKGLAGYFLDEDYMREHPYIPTKIKTEVEVIRRTLKMLRTNEEAQNALIKGIALDPSKAALFSSLTSLQNAAGSLHKQLTEHVEELEIIFQKIEDATERSFANSEKEDSEDNLKVNRGTKEFLMKLKNKTE